MPGFDAQPPLPEEHDEVTARRNARYGFVLFAIYLAIYSVFVALNAFWPRLMAHEVIAGLNFAIVYGFGLIITALLLAAVYGWLCRTPRKPT
jgi:uncharacterized membrane protein (DUF485 family)